MNEIVKYNNDISDLVLSDFTSTEMKILFSLCREVREKDCEVLFVTFQELKRLSNFTGKNDGLFVNELRRTNEKLLNLKLEVQQRDENKKSVICQLVLFPTFTIYEDEKYLRVRVNPDFKYLCNELLSDFTRFPLEEVNSLKSK